MVIHRLGNVPGDERDEFERSFLESSLNLALISVTDFPLYLFPDTGSIERGRFIKIDNSTGLLYTQGASQYSNGSTKKQYLPKSCPSALKIKISCDTGVYASISDAAKDIFSLTRMNWRHTAFFPSTYPVSLQYAMLVTQNLKNRIRPAGDYKDVCWFL